MITAPRFNLRVDGGNSGTDLNDTASYLKEQKEESCNSGTDMKDMAPYLREQILCGVRM